MIEIERDGARESSPRNMSWIHLENVKSNEIQERK